jgi:hypothetical protein
LIPSNCESFIFQGSLPGYESDGAAGSVRWLLQAKHVAGLGRGSDAGAKRFCDAANLGHHRRVARREDTASEIDAVFHTDTDMPACEIALPGLKSVRSSVQGSWRPSQCLSRRDRLLVRSGGLGLQRTKRP